MQRSASFDTQIAMRVSDGQIAAHLWNSLKAALGRKYAYRVSLTTFMELLNALAGGDEEHFEHNRRRLLTLTEVPGYEFLPLPGQFIRHVVLNMPLERPGLSACHATAGVDTDNQGGSDEARTDNRSADERAFAGNGTREGD